MERVNIPSRAPGVLSGSQTGEEETGESKRKSSPFYTKKSCGCDLKRRKR
jgi:hypothetical protein